MRLRSHLLRWLLVPLIALWAIGFRVQYARTLALANEAYDAVNQGIAAPEGIDIAMRLGANYPRGPLEWAMTIGLATIRTVLRNLGDGYGEDRYRVSPLIEQHYFAARGQPRHANWPAADTQSPR